MTIPSTPRKAGPLLGNGVQTSWPFTFKVFADTDILVIVADNLGIESELTLTSDYTVTLNSNQETSPGGAVTYLLPDGYTLVITGDIDYDQPLDLPSGGAFSPTALENELDRLTMQIQQLREAVNRAVQAPITSNASGYLPSPQSNTLIGWNESETAMQNFPLSEIATAIAFATYRYDTYTGDGTTTSFVLSADPVTLGNIDVSVDGQTYVPGVDHTLVGQNLVFTVAPADGAEILARYGQGIASGVSGDALDISYQPAGVGAELTTTQDKLREFVSVKDFGAVGDGVTDDTAALQAAIASFPNQGSPTWESWCLFFPNGVYKTTAKITVKNQQFGRIIGSAATIIGNFNDTVIQFGDGSGVADNLWFHVEGLNVQQQNTGASAYAVRAFHNYSCTFRNCFFYGGQYAFTLDGNANVIEGCTFRSGIAGNVLAAGASNNQANKFIGCSNELSAGYGYDFSVAAGLGGLTVVDGGYTEANALGAFRIKNSQKATIRDVYLNVQNLAPGVVLDGTVGADYAQPFVSVEGCNILGDASTSTPFIKELTANSINAQYRNNRVETGIVDMYGAAPRSINIDRKRKFSTVVNGTSIVNTDATGASDGWTLAGGGTGNVGAVSSVSPYVNGSACSISFANSYQYQQINCPASSLIRVSVWAKCSGALANADVQLWSLGLGGQYTSVNTTSTTASRLDIYLTPAMRSNATSFLLLLRNTGSGDNAQFCDIDIEDMTT